MRILVSIAALATATMLVMPAPSAEAGGMYARDRGTLWCPTDWFRRDRARVAAAPAVAGAAYTTRRSFDWFRRDRARVAAAPVVAGAAYTRDRVATWRPFDWFRRDRVAGTRTVRPRR